MTEYELLKAWTEAAGLQREGRLIDFSLRVRSPLQQQLLRTVYDSIAAIGPVLQRWEQGGTDTMGMAEFAAAWERRPPGLVIHGRPTHETPDRAHFAFELNREQLCLDRDALYLLMQCQVPQGPDTEAQLNLRAWVFMQGIELARGKTTADRYLADACHPLRRAAYELPHEPWRQALEPLGPWTRTLEALTEHLKSRDEDLKPAPVAEGDGDGAAQPNQAPKESAQARAIKRIARFAQGKRGRLEERESSRFEITAAALELLAHPPSADTPGEQLERAESFPVAATRLRLPDMAPSDEIDDETTAFEVDPEESPFNQSLHVRSAQLQLGAAARFLRWDWPQVAPPELHGFERLLHEGLSERTDERIRLLAALAWTAREAGLGLEDCLQIPIEPLEPQLIDAEWSIDLKRGLLRRRPPRRADHRHLTEEQTYYVRSAASHIQLPVAPAALDALRSAQARRPAARFIGQTWSDPSRAASSAFRQWVKTSPLTHRLQPAMLGRMLGQRTYELTRDHVLARLLPSTPQSALPASTVYAAFNESDLQQIWPALTALPPSTTPLNVAGSLLDVMGDDHLAHGFKQARATIERLAVEGNWIRFHNAVALFWDAVLRAATGVRPVSTLWLTPDDFDWDLHFVFVDDKASPVADSGRLIPLPAALCHAFRTAYLEQHLPWALRRLAKEVDLAAADVPMLFVVEFGRDGHKPKAITHELRAKLGIEAPLPLNVFRHRLRTRLHTPADVDKEIIDAVLGHGDGATLTHGDYSMRTWLADANAIRPALTSIFEGLAIQFPPPPAEFEALADEATVPNSGLLLRHAPPRRKSWSLLNAAGALRIIRRYLRALDDTGELLEGPSPSLSAVGVKRSAQLLPRLARLSSTELDTLSRLLLARDDGLPDTTGRLRYEFLLTLGETLWTKHALRLAIRRRYSVRELEDSPFRREAAGALSLLVRLRSTLDSLFDRVSPHSRLPLGQTLCLLVFDLCLTSRITHPQVLDSLLDDEDRWRVVRLQDRFYLEWSPHSDLTVERSAACIRFPISQRAAWLLTEVLRGKIRRRQAWALATHHAQPLADLLVHHQEIHADKGSDPALVPKRLRSLVDQANIIELPGTVAGYLAGRVLSTSLSWGDWLRVREGRWTDTSSLPLVVANIQAKDSEDDDAPHRVPRYAQLEDEDDDEEMAAPSPATRLVRRKETTGSPDDRSRAAQQLVRGLQDGIRKLKETKGLTKRRAKKADQLSRAVHDKADEVSSAIRLLCLWAIDMLLRPGRSRKLATSSVDRYFVALSPRFLAVGCDIQLDRMDDDDIEDFYTKVMEVAAVQHVRDVYIGLRNFHRFAHQSAGLPDIDWSAIAISNQVILGSPGFVDEASYLRLLDHLGTDEGCAAARPWQLQAFAVLAYRFGLRGGEIGGLTQADLLFDGHHVHVLVRRNRLRALKRSNSRRIVPLLFTLTDAERRALQRLRDEQLPAVNASASDTPLFMSRDGTGAQIDDLATRAHINAVLKQVTGQAGTTMHDLRHSFAANVWAATQAPAWPLLGLDAQGRDRTSLAATLLGPDCSSVSRRSPWALTRLMGHAHVSMHLRAYVHCISDALDWLVDTSQARSPRGVDNESIKCVRLDDAPTIDPQPTAKPSRLTPATDPSMALVALRYIAAGRTDEETANYTRLSPSDVAELRRASEEVFEPLASSKRSGMAKHLQERTGRARLAHTGLLAFVHASAFERLRAALSKFGSERHAQLATIERISAEHWSAMIGPRREISMWLPNHFQLMAIAVRSLTPPTRSAQLCVPMTKAVRAGLRTDGPLHQMGVASGWLPIQPGGAHAADGLPPLCSSIATTPKAPAVWLESSGTVVKRRAVLLFEGAGNGHVRDRLELLLAALCMNLFTKPANLTL